MASIFVAVSPAFVKGFVPFNCRKCVLRSSFSYLETGTKPFFRSTSVPSSTFFTSASLTEENADTEPQHNFSSAASSSSSPPSIMKPWQTLFDLELPEGRCVGIRLDTDRPASDPDALSVESMARPDHWIHDLLHPDEIQHASSQPSESSQLSFILGRLAMRQAMIIPTEASILKDEYGRPNVPAGYLGSISHKKTTGVALVAQEEERKGQTDGDLSLRMGIGVDIEHSFSGRRSIEKRILTERELGDLGRIKGMARDEEVLLRFSLKEALYKACHPLICQYVSFKEAEVTPHEDGTASIRWNLNSGAHERFDVVTAHWRRVLDDDFFLSSGSVTLKDDKRVVPECVL